MDRTEVTRLYDRYGRATEDLPFIEELVVTPFQGFWYLLCDYLTPLDIRKLMKTFGCSMEMSELNRVGMTLHVVSNSSLYPDLYLNPVSPLTMNSYTYTYKHYYQFRSINIKCLDHQILALPSINIKGYEVILKGLLKGGKLVMSDSYQLVLSYELKDKEKFEEAYNNLKVIIDRYTASDRGMTSRMVRHALNPTLERITEMASVVLK